MMNLPLCITLKKCFYLKINTQSFFLSCWLPRVDFLSCWLLLCHSSREMTNNFKPDLLNTDLPIRGWWADSGPGKSLGCLESSVIWAELWPQWARWTSWYLFNSVYLNHPGANDPCDPHCLRIGKGSCQEPAQSVLFGRQRWVGWQSRAFWGLKLLILSNLILLQYPVVSNTYYVAGVEGERVKKLITLTPRYFTQKSLTDQQAAQSSVNS